MERNKNFSILFLQISLIIILMDNIMGQTTTKMPDHYQRHSVEYLINQGIEIGKGLIKDFGNLLPTFEEILDAPKQLIFGLPPELIFNAINSLCSTALKTDSVKRKIKPKINGVDIQLRTKCKNFAYAVQDFSELMKNQHFNRSKKVVILASGWFVNPNNTGIVKTLQKAYLCRDDVNFFVFDAVNYIDTLYFWSALNVRELGSLLSIFISDLLNEIPLENLHLIGHSLGAHIMSYASKSVYQTTGKKIKRLTGLDPARLCFNEGEEFKSLSRDDAEFVDIIHTNPGGLGKFEAIGHVDFYTNGYETLAPGCFDFLCSHRRSWHYFAESVYPGNEENFMATSCSSLKNLRHDNCQNEKYPMGYATPNYIRGRYFLEVNSMEPYGKHGDEEREKMYKNCGLCETEQLN